MASASTDKRKILQLIASYSDGGLHVGSAEDTPAGSGATSLLASLAKKTAG